MDKDKAGGTGLETHVACTLAYLGGWISGLIFLLVETRNRIVRFHAMQSIVTFGSLTIVIVVLSWLGSLFTLVVWEGALMPVSLVFTILWALVLAFSIVLWLLLMLRSYHNQHVLLPLAGDLSFWLMNRFGIEAPEREAVAFRGLGGELPHRPEARAWPGGRHDSEVARAIGSVAVIVWSIFLLVVFNFYADYIAFYFSSSGDGVNQLLRYPIFTSELSRVLPVLNLSLGMNVAGHLLVLVWNRYLVKEAVEVVLHVLGLAAAIAFLRVFPFDYGDLPVHALVTVLPTLTVAVLVLAIVGNIVEIVVHLARFFKGLSTR